MGPMRRALAPLLCLCACGPSVEGSVGGHGLHLRSSLVLGREARSVIVALYDTSDACAKLSDPSGLLNTTILALELLPNDSSVTSPPLGPGRFEVDPTAREAQAISVVGDFTVSGPEPCVHQEWRASSGSVVLDSIDAASAHGTFELSFAGGDRLSGGFAARACDPAPLAPGTPGCQ